MSEATWPPDARPLTDGERAAHDHLERCYARIQWLEEQLGLRTTIREVVSSARAIVLIGFDADDPAAAAFAQSFGEALVAGWTKRSPTVVVGDDLHIESMPTDTARQLLACKRAGETRPRDET